MATGPLSDDETVDMQGVGGVSSDAPLVLPPRYADLGLLGRGGMGEVRAVRDRVLGHTVALKVLDPRLLQHRELVERFENEARITAGLSHPGVVSVHDLGRLPDGRPWYTMDVVGGRTLAEVVRDLHGAAEPSAWPASGWTLRRVVHAFSRACEAVAAAHAGGVIHRDLKPQNVMIGDFGEVRVMDWGLARAEGQQDVATSSELPNHAGTQAGRVMGTPGYMAPEQARGDLMMTGPPADVYALGAMLYEVLSGRRPYPGKSRVALRSVLAGPPVPVRRVGLDTHPPAPSELCAVVERAMAREISGRYPDAAALAADVEGWLEGARRRAEALELVQAARALRPRAAALRREAAALRGRAASMLAELPPDAPVDDKALAWELEDRAAELGREARLVEADDVRTLRASLAAAPDLRDAHADLADVYRRRLEAAEAEEDVESAAEAELLLRAHDRGQHVAWLRGDGAVTLRTDPPGAVVRAFRYERSGRRLVPVEVGVLGVTPIEAVPLAHGSYVLQLELAGHVAVS